MDTQFLIDNHFPDDYVDYGTYNHSHKINIFTNVSNKNMFVVTNKCGLHTLFYTLPEYGYRLNILVQPILDLSLDNNYIISKNNGYNKIFFIREPKERYITGLAEYIRILKKRNSFDHNKMMDQLLQGKIILDEHVLPQYFNLIPWSNDENLLTYNFNEFENRVKSIDKNINHVPVVNSKSMDDKAYARYLFNNFVDLELFNKIFKEDFELYRKSK